MTSPRRVLMQYRCRGCRAETDQLCEAVGTVRGHSLPRTPAVIACPTCGRPALLVGAVFVQDRKQLQTTTTEVN